jgi:hypothetical protein
MALSPRPRLNVSEHIYDDHPMLRGKGFDLSELRLDSYTSVELLLGRYPEIRRPQAG